ncbi:MAG: hypothetical protein ACLQU1_10520 [Bryobacteraceae bacterium]
MQAPCTPNSYQERVEQLERDNRLLQQQLEQARFKNKRLKKRLERLEKDLEKSRRAAHRQAAPFSKGEPQAEPKTPGRKAENGLSGNLPALHTNPFFGLGGSATMAVRPAQCVK